MKTAAQAAANWAGSAGRAGTAWQEGVQGYNGDWAGATTRQQSVMQQNWDQAVASGRWAAGVNAVDTSSCKSATVASVANFNNGFTKGAAAQAVAIGKIMNFLGSTVPNLPARGTYEQNKIRATTLMDALHSQRGNLGAQ